MTTVKTSPEINQLVEALAKARPHFGTITKTRDNPFFQSKYADLSDIIEAVAVPLAEQGIVIAGGTEPLDGGGYRIASLLLHSSGQYFEASMLIAAGKMQAMGSDITYARRYTLAPLLGIAPESDDDGNRAQTETPKERTRATKPPAVPPVNGQAPAPQKAPQQTTKAAARENTQRIQEAQEVLGQKPVENMNHEEAYVACQARLTVLAGDGKDPTSRQGRIDYMTAVFGTAIDSEVKMYQLGKSALQRGLTRLLEMRGDQPPVDPDVPMSIPPDLPQEQRSLPDESIDSAQGRDRATESQLDPFTVIPPDPPTLIDGYADDESLARLEGWAKVYEQYDMCHAALTRCPGYAQGHPAMTLGEWRRIVQAITYLASEAVAKG